MHDPRRSLADSPASTPQRRRARRTIAAMAGKSLPRLDLARLGRQAAWLSACLLAAVPARAAGAEPPARVVTLAPHITEMIFVAGAGRALVGTVVSSNHPDAARALPKVGDGAASVNAEKLIRLEPDLVLAWHRSGAAAAVAPVLQSLDIPLEFLAPDRLDDIPDQIEALGRRLGTAEQAGRAAAGQREALQALRNRYAHRPLVSVFIEIGYTPLYGVGQDALLNDALRACGGVNIFQDSALAALPIGPEHILQKHPGVILVAAVTPEQERHAQARWAALGLAPETGVHVHGIDPDALFRPGPRLLEATRKLCGLLDNVREETGRSERTRP